MAGEKIEFSLASKFDGEGFRLASQAIRDNAKEIQSARAGLGSLTKAFAEVSPQAATAVSAVSDFGKAFVSGGIVGGAITLSIQAISVAVEKFTDYMQSAKEETNRYAEMLRDRFITLMTSANTRLEKMSANIKGLTQNARDLASAMNEATRHDVSEKIYRVNVEKLQAITDTMTAGTRALVEAQAEQKIALIKATAAVDTIGQKVEVLNAEYANAAAMQKEATIAAREAELALTLARSETTISMEDLNKFIDDEKKAQQNLANANRALEQARLKSEAAENEYVEAQQNLTLTRMEQNQAVMDAEKKLEEETKKAEEARKKELEAAQKLQEAEWDFANWLQKQKEKLDAGKSSWMDIVAMSEKLDKGEHLFDEGENKPTSSKDDGLGKRVRITNPGDIGSSVGVQVNIPQLREDIGKPKNLDNETYERIKNGTASVADWQRFDRFTENELQHGNETTHRLGSDAANFIKNADKPDTWLSNRDRQFNDTFKTKVLPQLSKDVAKELLGDASKKVLSSEKMKDILQDKKVIDSWLGKLGLK